MAVVSGSAPEGAREDGSPVGGGGGTQLALLARLCHTGTRAPSPGEAPARSRPVRVGVPGELWVRRRAGKPGAGGDPQERAGHPF